MRQVTRLERGIIRLRETGLSYSQIAMRAKCSRGVVASALYRFRTGKLVLPNHGGRGKSGCRWVNGDPKRQWSWCGAPVTGDGAWCAEHRRVVYHPP
jgi:transposase